MSDTESAINFAVPCPEAGENAIITFDFHDMERLEAEFGDDYVNTIFTGLDAMRLGIVRKCLEIGLKAGDLDCLLRRTPIAESAKRIADAIYLTLHGRKISDAIIPSDK